MITLLATIALTPVGSGIIQVDGLAPEAQLLVEGKGCVANAEGHRIVGDPGCLVKIAIIEPDGNITRVVGVLPAPRAQPPQPPPKTTTATPSPANAPTTAPATSPSPTTDAAPTSSSFTAPPPGTGYTVELGVFRGVSDFGFVGAHLGLAKRILPWLELRAQWHHGTGRAATPNIPDQLEHIEETLDLMQGLAVARYGTGSGVSLFAGLGGFVGLLEADEVRTDTTTLSASSQAISGVVGAAGIEAQAGRARLNIGWTAHWAGGEWYPADNYGGALDGPPSRFDLLTHGVSVTVGIEL